MECEDDVCPEGYICFCNNDPNGEWLEEGGDEAGDPECGTVMLDPVTGPAVVIVSHNSCAPEVEHALEVTGTVPFSLSEPKCEAPIRKFRCFTEIELVDDGNPDNDLWCAFCPELTGVAPADGGDQYSASLCWQDADDWSPATLGAAVPAQWYGDGWPDCSTIETPLGELLGHTLPIFCTEGFSCLDGGRRCSCNCRDTQTGLLIGPSLVDYYAWWWSAYPDAVPPMAEGPTYPVEGTCTGEPLMVVPSGDGQAVVVGTTLELDGYDPAYPPNGELHHTPAWDLLPSEPYLLDSLPQAYVSTLMAFPSEAQHGGSQVDRSTGTVTACSRGSLCDRVGLDAGDRLLQLDFVDGVIELDYMRETERRRIAMRVAR